MKFEDYEILLRIYVNKHGHQFTDVAIGCIDDIPDMEISKLTIADITFQNELLWQIKNCNVSYKHGSTGVLWNKEFPGQASLRYVVAKTFKDILLRRVRQTSV